MIENRVEALYDKLKRMAVDFRIRPGERLNEVALARELATSRTPLREALNRLVAEQLVTFQPGRGFRCRALDADAIFALYDMRVVLEEAAVRLACTRARDDEIEALRCDLYDRGLLYVGRSVREVTEVDEAFHVGIARLAKNNELVRQLESVNDRIRYVRWIDMAARVRHTKGEHEAIMAAIVRRDADTGAAEMRMHIVKRTDQVVAVVREGYSNIYMPGNEVLFERPLDS